LIPASYIQEWSTKAPWPTSQQVEQDLIISRALCDLFNAPALAGKIAFRGGTAIHKLLFKQPLRYSEDIDLVQTQAEQIGTTASAIREALSWLGDCKREQAGHSMHFVFRFAPEAQPDTTLKVKVEINTREHDSVLGIQQYPFAVENGWYQATPASRHLRLKNSSGPSCARSCSAARIAICSTCTWACSNYP
jgi:hypothetical protein